MCHFSATLHKTRNSRSHLLVQVRAQLLLCLLHAPHADARQVVARSAQPNGLRNGGRARLKPQRRLLVPEGI